MQVPGIVDFAANASLGTMQTGTDSVEVTSFPLYSGGARRMHRHWIGNGSFPDSMGEEYSPDQLVLLCLAQVGI